MKPTFKLLATFSCGAAVTLAAVFAVRARAAGIPDAAALTYTGYLESPDGTPVTSTKGIGISLYAAESGGKEVCGVKPTDIEPVAGRFQIPLPEDCTAAVKANPNLWAEVMVEGALLGRTKLGAVPFAVEAGHADHSTLADTATNADKAKAADKADTAAQVPWSGVKGVPGVNYAVATSTTPFLTSSLSFVNVPGLAATLTSRGGPVLLTANLNINPETTRLPNYGSWGVATITRDGTNLGAASFGLQVAGADMDDNVPTTITFMDAPPAGVHTYSVQVRAGEAGVSVTVGEAGGTQQLAAVEIK